LLLVDLEVDPVGSGFVLYEGLRPGLLLLCWVAQLSVVGVRFLWPGVPFLRPGVQFLWPAYRFFAFVGLVLLFVLPAIHSFFLEA